MTNSAMQASRRHQHRHAARHRLHVDQAQRVDPAGEHEHARRRVELLQRVAALQADEAHELLVAVACARGRARSGPSPAMTSSGRGERACSRSTASTMIGRFFSSEMRPTLRITGRSPTSRLRSSNTAGAAVRRREVVGIDRDRHHRQLVGALTPMSISASREPRREREDAIDVRVEPGQVAARRALHEARCRRAAGSAPAPRCDSWR